MNLENIEPSETYEGLRSQFFALKKLLQCKEVEVNVYRKRIAEFKMERIIVLEAELDSQKEMNAILTDELELLAIENEKELLRKCDFSSLLKAERDTTKEEIRQWLIGEDFEGLAERI